MSTSPQTSFADLRDEKRRKIDEEIAQLESQLVSLRLARNILAPITCLHGDILQEIFSCLHETSPHKGKATLLLSWVCHGWRDLAHNTSSLWSHIDFSIPEWVQTSLSRAKNRELEFNLYPIRPIASSEHHHPLISLCLGNLSRTRGLRVLLGESAIFPQHAPEWLTPTPILEHFYLELGRLPPNVFSGIYPALQSLVLVGCELDWETLPIPPSLIALVIHNPVTKASAGRLFKVLGIIGQHLKQLSLRSVLDHEVNPILLHNKLSFQELELLSLSDYPAAITQLLANISLSLHTSVGIDMLTGEGSQEEMLHALVSSRNIESWPITCLEIRSAIPSTVLLMMKRINGPGNINRPLGTHPADNRTYIRFTKLNIHLLFHILPLRSIQKVEIIDLDTLDGELTLLTQIGGVENVQELHMDRQSLATFFVFIRTKMVLLQGEAGSDDASYVVEAPNALAFRNLAELHIDNGVCHLERGYWETLLEWLRCRQSYGFPLKKLFLSNAVLGSMSWLDELLDGRVGEFQMSDVVEAIPET